MVLPAPESGHALAVAARLASGRHAEGRSSRGVVACVSGHGYLDLSAYQQLADGELSSEPPAEEALLSAMDRLRPVPGLAVAGSGHAG
jgi:tryptophan synthase beta chain